MINVPFTPMILGIILGPKIENNLRVGLTKTGGNWMSFANRPISISYIILIFLVFFRGNIVKLVKKLF
ncbi:MAG: putative tricarboxylic transport rane protein [Thermosipho sp. (in: thermotogales)]|nr:putative tricarboxylic transport rane protein [Thermosipho sp. (in: thermotogales)]